MEFYNDGTPVGFGLLKTAADPGTRSMNFGVDLSKLSDPKLQRTLGYAGGGAALGALVGGLSSKENRLRNALIGGALGGLGGYAFDRYGHDAVAGRIAKLRSR